MIRSEIFDDIYFSAADGLAESRHVFLAGNDLPARWNARGSGRGRFTIAETGFGTGLNMLAAWAAFDETAGPDQRLDLISFEQYPLTPAQIRDALSPWAHILATRIDAILRDYPLRVAGWHVMDLSPRVRLTLIFDDVNDALPRLNVPGGVDAWFLDGFAPAKNPQMWTDTVFNAMAAHSATDATFATFTAAGIVKRGLSDAGFTVEKVRGFGHKRDMLAGRYARAGAARPESGHAQRIAVIGGGLAGCAAARALADDGHDVVLHEKGDGLACGASGNARGIVNPRLSARRGADSDFYTAGFALASRVLARYGDMAGHHPCGSLHLAVDVDKEKRFLSCIDHWGWHADHMRYVDAHTASDIAGVTMDRGGLFLPDSAQDSPAGLCRAMARDVTRRGVADIAGISHDGSQWRVDGDLYDGVILACGPESILHPSLHDSGIHSVRGQIITVPATAQSAAIKCNICYGGYIGAARDGAHVLGSTFQHWLNDTDVRDDDTRDIVARALAVVPGAGWSADQALSARAALRCASRDRFPVIGAMTDSPPGLYASTAHGSHGIVSSLIGARILSAMIGGGVAPVPADTLAALDPGRFARRRVSGKGKQPGGKT